MTAGGAVQQMSHRLRVIIATAVVGILVIGPHFVVSEYREPILDQHPDWSPSFLQHTVAVGSVGYVVSGFIGADIRNRGYPFYAVTGCILAAMSHLLGALAVRYNRQWLFLVGQGFFDTLGGGCLMTVIMSHATGWLDPAFAASLVGGMVGISATTLSYAMAGVMVSLSAEICLWGLTGIAVLASVSAPLFLMPPPLASSPTLSTPLNSVTPCQDPLTRVDLLRNRQFLFVWLQVATGLTPGFALISSYSGLFVDALGVTFFTSAIFTGICNATYCIGRILGGIMCRRLGVKRWGCALVLVGVVGCIAAPCGQLLHQSWLMVSGVAMVAFQLGANQVYAGPLIVHVFGKLNMPTAYGLILIAVAFASVVGPVALLAPLSEHFGRPNEDIRSTYNVFFFVSAGVLLISLASITMTCRRATGGLVTAGSLESAVVITDEPSSQCDTDATFPR
jgi:hypothetical protein